MSVHVLLDMYALHDKRLLVSSNNFRSSSRVVHVEYSIEFGRFGSQIFIYLSFFFHSERSTTTRRRLHNPPSNKRSVMHFKFNKTSELYAPKRRFWKVVPTFQNAFSKRLSTIRRQNRVLTTLKSAFENAFWKVGSTFPNLMLPKRRFWKAEQTFQTAFSKHFPTFCCPNRVLTPLKSASPGKRVLKCLFGLPKSSFGRGKSSFGRGKLYAPQTKIVEGLTKDEIRIFDILFNG
jgi:hypothetical protein